MARTAMTELQQQIEEVRREAFAAGYAAAMQAIQELASRPPPMLELLHSACEAGRGGGDPRRPEPLRQRHAGAEPERTKVPQGAVDRQLAGQSVARMHKGSRRS
jgi:hypothetical protein